MSKELPLILGQKATAILRGEEHSVAIRGWLPQKYIITDLPTVNGEHFRVAAQTGCSINFIRNGMFVSFRSTVIYALAQVVTLLIIEYPKTFEMYNLRKNERFKSNFPLSYTYDIAGAGFTENGTIRDLSLSGLLFTHSKPIPKDSLVHIKTNLPTGNLENLEAVVRNIRKNPQIVREPFVTGLQFVRVSEANKEILRKFIESRVIDRRSGERHRAKL